jgi:transcription elongation GreA/GreB family factor
LAFENDHRWKSAALELSAHGAYDTAMSVAFRREVDEEHLEPKFGIPIAPGPNLVTARGKALIDEQVRTFAAILKAPNDEASQGAAKRDLRYWETRQITAEVMPQPSGDTVEFGTTVSFTLCGKPRSLSIVGTDEADGASDLLSFTAPLARALMGAEPGDVLPFSGDDDAIEVLAVTVLPSAPIQS